MKSKSIILVLVIPVLVFLTAIAATAEPPSPTPKNEEKAVDIAAQLEAAKKELVQLRTRFGEEHPRVKMQLKRIAELEHQLAQKK